MPALREVRAVSAEPFKSTPATPTPSQRPTTTLPVGVIAGSLAGGVALAIVIVLAWTYWGKSFQHHQRKQVVCAADHQYGAVKMLTVSIIIISAQCLQQETASVVAPPVILTGRKLPPYGRWKSCIWSAKTSSLKAPAQTPPPTTIESQTLRPRMLWGPLALAPSHRQRNSFLQDPLNHHLLVECSGSIKGESRPWRKGALFLPLSMWTLKQENQPVIHHSTRS